MNMLLAEARVAVHIVWRRRWLALGVAWGVALLGWLAVSLIPNSYRSTARIYVEPQSILPQAVGISSNDQQQGIDNVRQQLLSADTLAEVARSTDLARGGPAAAAAQVARLTRAVEIKTVQDNLYTISTTLSGGGFSDAQNARIAQQVTAALTDRFVTGSAAGDQAEARRSLAFLDQQLSERGAALQKADSERSAFEQRFLGALPGTGSVEDRIGMARSQIADIDSQLAAAQSSAAALNGQLAATPATLPGLSVPGGGGGGARARLATLQAQLAEDQAKGWTEQHPDVIALRDQIARLQPAAAAEPAGGAAGAMSNPTYASLRAMAAEKQANAAALATRRAQIQADLTAFANLQATQPALAAQQADLSRSYAVLKAQYDKLLSDRETVKLRADAQAQDGTVTVRVLDAANRPRLPAKPARPLLLTAVLLAAIAAGVGVAFARAKLTTSFSTAAALATASGLPVLGTVGFVRGERQMAARARQLRWFAGSGGALAAAWLVLLAAEFIQRGLMA